MCQQMIMAFRPRCTRWFAHIIDSTDIMETKMFPAIYEQWTNWKNMIVQTPRHTTTESMTTIKTLNIRGVANTSFQLPKFKWIIWILVVERTDYILDTLFAEYIQQAFTDSSRSFIVCVQCNPALWWQWQRVRVACLKHNTTWTALRILPIETA